MPLFEQHEQFIKLFLETTARQRKALLLTSTGAQRLMLAELIFNFLKGNISDIQQEKEFFLPYKNILRKLSKKVTVKKQKLFAKHSRVLFLFLEKILPKLK